MAAITPRTVLVYSNGSLAVARGHLAQNDPLVALHGEQPVQVFHVRAGGDTEAMRQALIARSLSLVSDAPAYSVQLTATSDLTLHRLTRAQQRTEQQVLDAALNLYAALCTHEYAFVHARDAQGRLVVKKLAIP